MDKLYYIEKLDTGSEIDRLKWLIDSFPRKVNVSLKEKQKTDVFPITASSLFRLAAETSQAIIILLENNHLEASVMLERNLYEIWCEFRYLLEHKEKGAAKAAINAAIEYIDFFKDSKGFKESEIYSSLNYLTDFLGEKYPEQIKEIVKQRKSRKFHWSGLTKTKIVKSVVTDNNPMVYRFLSWETHAVMTALRDIIQQNGEDITFKESLSKVMTINDIAFRTTGYLYCFWIDYADTFGLEKIKISEYHSS